ncbi:autotransporter domain-containing protein [Pseudomonas gingeri]|uniref:autotransporter domain-containing protein n=1 Tax=Pseudomonas gingeri TaxID=117681 RepID=UPI0015A110B5|nr:autotransporter domain-containing protein [Pseudomonas gingeri]NWD77089.1 autotransporter domain-containing protein [Pseudomonas gingeri]
MPLTPHHLALAITLALTTVVLRDTHASSSRHDGGSAQSTSVNFDSLQADQGDTVALRGTSIDYTNHRDGEIQAITGNAIKVRGRGVGRISNDGKITSERHDGIDLGAGDIALNNAKTVTGGRHGVTTRHQGTLINRGQVSGLNGAGFHSAGSGQVTNYDSLTGDATSSDADGDGIRIKGQAEIYNIGQIVGNGSRGVDQYGDPHTSEGIAIGGGTLVQHAKGRISGADHGIVVSDGNHNPAQWPTKLENYGSIHGHKGFGLQFIGEQADSVTNNGLIHGGNGHALDLGGGDDTLIVQGNSRFEGSVDGNAGYDKVILDSPEGGHLGGSRNFERLEVRQGTWSLTGENPFSTSIEILPEAQLLTKGGTGLHLEGGTKLVNRGTVAGTTSSANSDADGLRVRGNAQIDNHGRITGSGANGFEQGGPSGADVANPRHSSEGVRLNGGRLTNHEDGVIEGQHNGILADADRRGPLRLENHGTLRGLSGVGASLSGQFADTVINGGVIDGGGGVALNLGGGNDTLIVKNGSRFSGWVDGGTTDDYQEQFQFDIDPDDTPLKANDDQVILDDTQGGSFGNSRHFERLLVKQGTWTLTSQDDFSKDAEVLTHLINNGSILGTARVNEGATYGGNGSVGHLQVTGTFEVDPQLGAAKIKEHLTLEPGATLAYGVDANGNSATVEVGGTAHLDGALLLKVQTDDPSNRQHTVIKASKLEGRFASIRTNLALLTATAHYSPTQVGLTYKRNDVNLGDLGNTSNGHNAGDALDSWTRPSLPPPTLARPPEPIAAGPVIALPELVASGPAITLPEPNASEPANTLPNPFAAGPAITLPEPDASEPANTLPHPVAAAPAITLPEPDASEPANTPPNPVAATPAIIPEPTAEEDQDIELSDEPMQQPSPDSPLRHATRYISAVEAGQALDQLSGGGNAQLRNATLSGSRQVGSSLLTVMRQTEDQPSQGGKVQVMNGGHGRLWVQGLGNSARFDSIHGHHGLRQNTRGLVLGADWALDSEWRVGVLGGQSQSDFKGQGFTGDLDSWHAGVYALRQDGPLALRLGAVYSSHSGKTGRRVAFNGYRDHFKGDYDANSQQAFAEVGYRFGDADLRVEPFTGLGYERYQRDRFTERGGEAALAIDSQTHGNLNSNVGLRVSSVTTFDNKMSLTPHLSAGWKHLYGDVGSTTQQKFAVSDRTFKVQGAALDRDSLLLEAGLDLKLSPRQNLGLGYTGEVSSHQRKYGLMGQWRLTF